MSFHYYASTDYPKVHVLKSIDCKRAAMNESTSELIWGSEFRLVRNNNRNGKVVLRFISPKDGHEWTIYIRAILLIVADQTQQLVDDLGEPSLEIVDDYTPHILTTY
jgi:hypothetical protein